MQSISPYDRISILFISKLEVSEMPKITSDEVLEFMNKVYEIGGTITSSSDGLVIRLNSPRHLPDFIHKLESIYSDRRAKSELT